MLTGTTISIRGMPQGSPAEVRSRSGGPEKLLGMLAGVASTLLLAAGAGTAAPQPPTVPALRAWHGGTSGLSWALMPRTRVVSRAFPREARTLAHDLHVATARHARDGDIV